VVVDFTADSNNAAEEYNRIAELNLTSHVVLPTINHVLEKRKLHFIDSSLNPPCLNPPFTFIEASSGVGKTQLAMTLALAIRSLPSARFYYFLYSIVTSNSQSVYQKYSNRSSGLRECITMDLRDLQSADVSVENLKQKKLFTFGYMLQLLRGAKGKAITISKASCVEVRTLITKKSTLTNKSIDPTVFIDEFITKDQEDRARLTRNLFRASGFFVIISGTDSNARNMIDSSEESRLDDRVLVSCCMQTS